MVMPDTAIKRSAQELNVATDTNPYGTLGYGGPGMDGIAEVTMFSIAQFADEVSPWGQWPRLRDVQLREFMPSESILASSFATVASRNASFAWKVDGGSRQVSRAQSMLQAAHFGAGWRAFIIRLTLDLIGQDNGAFVELIRDADRPTAPVVGIANLDAGRCWRTGDPRNPVLYTDIKGVRHLLPYWRVIKISEMPSNIERLRGLQYSAATRALRSAQYFRDVVQFQRERMGGRRPSAIHFVDNVTADSINDALVKAAARADNQNLYRYMDPIFVQTLKPGAPVNVVTADLANLPVNFDAAAAFSQYIAQMALALLVDYQDLAPLPGGNLGTSTQSEVLSRKTRGKGPALFQKLIEDAFNFYNVLGEGVTFSFDEIDDEERRIRGEAHRWESQGDMMLVNAGILTPAIVRQQMVDRGDLKPEYLELLNEQDVTDETTGTDAIPVANQGQVNPAAVTADQVAQQMIPPNRMNAPVAPTTGAVNPLAQQLGGRGIPAVIRKDPQHIAMDDTEAAAKARYAAALDTARAAFRRAVEKGIR